MPRNVKSILFLSIVILCALILGMLFVPIVVDGLTPQPAKAKIVPPQKMPPQNMPPQNMPPQNMPPPPQKMPPQNMPPQNMPPQNMPPQNMPPQNMPPQNMPPQNMPPGPAPSTVLKLPPNLAQYWKQYVANAKTMMSPTYPGLLQSLIIFNGDQEFDVMVQNLRGLALPSTPAQEPEYLKSVSAIFSKVNVTLPPQQNQMPPIWVFHLRQFQMSAPPNIKQIVFGISNDPSARNDLLATAIFQHLLSLPDAQISSAIKTIVKFPGSP